MSQSKPISHPTPLAPSFPSQKLHFEVYFRDFSVHRRMCEMYAQLKNGKRNTCEPSTQAEKENPPCVQWKSLHLRCSSSHVLRGACIDALLSLKNIPVWELASHQDTQHCLVLLNSCTLFPLFRCITILFFFILPILLLVDRRMFPLCHYQQRCNNCSGFQELTLIKICCKRSRCISLPDLSVSSRIMWEHSQQGSPAWLRSTNP